MNRLNLRLADGRNLEYAENDIESNAAIIIHSGTSGDICGWQVKGIGMYGWLRSTQMRRMRAPAPQVTRGDKI